LNIEQKKHKNLIAIIRAHNRPVAELIDEKERGDR